MPKNRKLQNIIGTEHIPDAAEAAIAAQASGGATVAFKNVAVAGQDIVVADAATDTLTLVGGSNVTITTDASADSVTIAAADTVRTVTAGGNTLAAGETLAFTEGTNITISESGGAVTIAASGGGISELIVDDEIINSSYTRYNLHRLPIWGQIGTGAGTLSNQDAPVFRPFIGPHSGTITEFGIECTTADASGTTKAKIAIYTNQNGAPHTKMGEIDIPCTSTGATFITSGLPTVTLVRDTQYWWGYCRSNNTNSLTVRATSNSQVTWLGPSTSTGSSLNSQSVLQLSSSDNTMPTTITQANLVPTYIAPVHCSLKFS